MPRALPGEIRPETMFGKGNGIKAGILPGDQLLMVRTLFSAMAGMAGFKGGYSAGEKTGDYHRPALSGSKVKEGFEVIKEARRIKTECKIIVITGYGVDDTSKRALQLGADTFLGVNG
jgi:hypothetical protein